MVRKMDTNDSMNIWIQSLGLLFHACEPLTYDCDRTDEEQAALIRDIEKHAYYCQEVKDDIERGLMPETWDEWNNQYDDSVVEEADVTLEPIDRRGFGDVLTRIYDGGIRKG